MSFQFLFLGSSLFLFLCDSLKLAVSNTWLSNRECFLKGNFSRNFNFNHSFVESTKEAQCASFISC